MLRWLQHPPPELTERPKLSLAEFESHLRSGETQQVVLATMQAPGLGPQSLALASQVATDPLVPPHGRVWALNSVYLFAGSHRQVVCETVIAALADSAVGVRSLAVHIVGELGCEDAVPHLVNLLGDSAPDPGDWSGEATVHDAVLAALRRLGTPQALAALAKAGPSP
jgi:hypothetical protein